jgi:hypothetical protein
MGFRNSRTRIDSRVRPKAPARRTVPWIAGVVAAAFLCGPAAAQLTPPRQKSQAKAITLTSLTEQGFEIKAVGRGEAPIVQKGKDVFWCILHLSDTSPLSYQSECYSIH